MMTSGEAAATQKVRTSHSEFSVCLYGNVPRSNPYVMLCPLDSMKSVVLISIAKPSCHIWHISSTVQLQRLKGLLDWF